MKKIIEAIKKHNSFLITAHVNLEGDSLGSQLAMKELVESLGKKAFVVDDDSVPGHYRFLPHAGEVSNDISKRLKFDAAIVVDCPTIKRIGRVREIIPPGKPVINIDHHISNDSFGTVNWVDPEASSAGEMVYRLFKAMGVKISKDAALSLYIAILTDTGSFNYENTSSATHEIAGELLGYGLQPAAISENVYERMSLSDIKLLGLVLATLKANKTGEIAYLEVTRRMLKRTGADLAKNEGLINYARSVDGVKVAILFKESTKDPRKIGVSFRSKGGFDVNKLAAIFGGGGHAKASGCSLTGTLSGVKKKVLKRVEEELDGRHTHSR